MAVMMTVMAVMVMAVVMVAKVVLPTMMAALCLGMLLVVMPMMVMMVVVMIAVLMIMGTMTIVMVMTMTSRVRKISDNCSGKRRCSGELLWSWTSGSMHRGNEGPSWSQLEASRARRKRKGEKAQNIDFQ